MKMYSKMIVALASMLCLQNVLLAQDKVFIPLFEVINMKKDYSYSTSRLLKDYTDLQNKYISIMQTKSDSNVVNSENADAVKSKAIELGAKYYLLGSLNRMGEVVIVSLSMYETANGTKVWSDKLKAQGPEDLDPILLRMAQNLGTVNKGDNSDDIYSVTATEQQELKKKQASNNFGVGLCAIPTLTHGYNFDKNAMLSGFSLNWSFDARDYIFDIKPSWCFNSEYDILSLALEMNKPLIIIKAIHHFGI